MKMSLAFLLVILISPMTYADWGDTYFCTISRVYSHNMKNEDDYKLSNFWFYLNKEKRAVVFGKGGYFDSQTRYLERPTNNMSGWEAPNSRSTDRMVFREGVLRYSFNSIHFMLIFEADCEKFISPIQP